MKGRTCLSPRLHKKVGFYISSVRNSNHREPNLVHQIPVHGYPVLFHYPLAAWFKTQPTFILMELTFLPTLLQWSWKCSCCLLNPCLMHLFLENAKHKHMNKDICIRYRVIPCDVSIAVDKFLTEEKGSTLCCTLLCSLSWWRSYSWGRMRPNAHSSVDQRAERKPELRRLWSSSSSPSYLFRPDRPNFPNFPISPPKRTFHQVGTKYSHTRAHVDPFMYKM